MENEELIKQVTEKAEKWLTPCFMMPKHRLKLRKCWRIPID